MLRVACRLSLLCLVLALAPGVGFAGWVQEAENDGAFSLNVVDPLTVGESGTSFGIGPCPGGDYFGFGERCTDYNTSHDATFQFSLVGFVKNKFRWYGSSMPGGCWVIHGRPDADGIIEPGLTALWTIDAIRNEDLTQMSTTAHDFSVELELPESVRPAIETVREYEHTGSQSTGYYGLKASQKNVNPQAVWVPLNRTTGAFEQTARFTTTVTGVAKNMFGIDYNMSCSSQMSVLGQNAAGQPEWQSNLVYAPSVPKADPKFAGGLTGPDPVNVITGDYLYMPSPDIAAYNPYGPSVIYRRNYCGARAKTGYGSPGLSNGWVDNYDVRLSQSSGLDDPYITLTFPTGGCDTFRATEASAGQPVRKFEACGDENSPIVKCVPYLVTGIANDSGSGWKSILVEWKDGTKWGFELANDCKPSDEKEYLSTFRHVYYLTSIANHLGQTVSIIRGKEGLVKRIENQEGSALLTFSYSGVFQLAYIKDAYGRKVIYKFDTSNLAGMSGDLISVSQLGSGASETIPAHWQYAYEKRTQKFFAGSYECDAAQTYLKSISFPSPSGTGVTTQTVNYTTPMGEGFPKVKSFTDGNGNKTEYEYGVGSTTVSIYNAESVLKQQKLYSYDTSKRLSSVAVQVGGESKFPVAYTYGNNAFPYSPTRVYDANGHGVNVTYDIFGSVSSMSGGRFSSVNYTYEYPASAPIGRVVEVIEHLSSLGQQKVMSVLQYNSLGLVQRVYSLKPGTSNDLVYTKSSFEYDSLGNITKVTSLAPGSPSTSSNEQYSYIGINDLAVSKTIKVADGTYSSVSYVYGSSPKLGQPISATDSATGLTSCFSYDVRGNVQNVMNALGVVTDYQYNIADQIEKVLYPGVEK